jgi:hypothetical protein
VFVLTMGIVTLGSFFLVYWVFKLWNAGGPRYDILITIYPHPEGARLHIDGNMEEWQDTYEGWLTRTFERVDVGAEV